MGIVVVDVINISVCRCRLVMVTLTTQASLVNVCDANVLYLAGFDASTPDVIRSFAVGDLDFVPAG